jgi:malate synthase
MRTPNQIQSAPGYAGKSVSESDLLRLPNIPRDRAITSEGLEKGVGIVLAYTEAWLRGIGCIPLHGAMEDAATAEISRAQIWQWRTQGASTADNGQLISADRITSIVQREVERQCGGAGSSKGKWRLAAQLVENMLNKNELDDFLTSVCYPYIVQTANEDVSHAKL